MNNQTHGGGCLCGAVTYRIAGPTGLTIASHIFVEDAGDYYDVPAGA